MIFPTHYIIRVIRRFAKWIINFNIVYVMLIFFVNSSFFAYSKEDAILINFNNVYVMLK